MKEQQLKQMYELTLTLQAKMIDLRNRVKQIKETLNTIQK